MHTYVLHIHDAMHNSPALDVPAVGAGNNILLADDDVPHRRVPPRGSCSAFVAPSNGNVDDEVEGIDGGEPPVEVVESAVVDVAAQPPFSSPPVALSAAFTSAVLRQLPMPMELKNTALLMLPVPSVALS